MDKKLRLTGYVGVAGSLLMYIGDMLLYFTTQPIPDREKDLLLSMGTVPLERLIAGGIIGPLAAVLYIIGFYHLFLRVKKARRKTACWMLASLSVSIIVGGAYHAFFPAFGIVSSQGHPEIIDHFLSYAGWLGGLAFALMGIGWIVFTVLAVQKQTSFPRWIVFATPLITIWLNFLWKTLPQPFLLLIAGGWNNLVYTLIFAVSLITLKNNIINNLMSYFYMNREEKMAKEDKAKMPKLKITETVLRDGHQSLIATRMTTEEMLPILETMDQVGYNAVEMWGGATYDACLRFLHEDPWERLRIIRKKMPNTKLQMLLRGQNLLEYRHYPQIFFVILIVSFLILSLFHLRRI